MEDSALLQEISELQFGEISLREDQYSHFLRLLKITEDNRYYIDMSPTGRGKSFVSLFLGMVMDLKILIFTEKSIVSTWANFVKLMDIEDRVTIIPYTAVPGRKGCNGGSCCGSLLIREDIIVPTKGKGKEKYKEKTIYHLSEVALKYFEDNTLVIFDEYHNINGGTSLTSVALRSITSLLMSSGEHRMGFLSATPAVKEENFVIFFKIIAVMTFKKLSTSRIVKLKGLGQIIQYCSTLDENSTLELTRRLRVYSDSRNHIRFCQTIWNRVIKPRFASRMEDFEYRINGRRGHFVMTPSELENYNNGIRDLANAVNWTGETFAGGSWDTRRQILGLKAIETAKIGIFYRQIRKSIDTRLRKAVVWVQFLETVDALTELLSDYNPGVIYGDVKMEERDRIIKSFISPTEECKILIISSRCLSSGVSIHFTENSESGEPYTVDVYISPSFYYIETCQFIGRFYRIGSVSIPNIWMVYPDNVGVIESNIIGANERKSKTLLATTSNAGSEVKTFFTSDFPKYSESEN